MFTDIPSLRDDLRERLADALPNGWKIITDLAAKTETLVPSVYIEFTGVNTEANGQPLPAGQVCAEVDLVAVDPRTDDALGEDGVETMLAPLLRALEQSDDLAWSTAQKQRLETGQYTWRISLIALTNL